MVDRLGRAVNEQLGLLSLTIENFRDSNKLEEWPLGQLVLKTHHLQFLKLAFLGFTTDDNKTQLLEFAAQVVTFSSCLHTLHIEGTNTTAADGAKFMQTLADDGFDWLQHLTIAN